MARISRATCIAALLGLCACAPDQLVLAPLPLRSAIDASEIESIEVLKGTTAAVIYGSATRCGPINITTRRAGTAPQLTRAHERPRIR